MPSTSHHFASSRNTDDLKLSISKPTNKSPPRSAHGAFLPHSPTCASPLCRQLHPQTPTKRQLNAN
eukprot:1184095-Prorocentrum_minimum.AAC.2